MLEVVEVEPGDIIKGGSLDFKSYVNASAGRISTMFVDETGVGNRRIDRDGVYLTITAKVLKEQPAVISLATDKRGIFADYDLNLIQFKFEEGGVNLSSSQPTSSPKPNTVNTTSR